ncbi:MAG: hypothetical protein ACJ8GK_04695 [Luteimonas sp.]
MQLIYAHDYRSASLFARQNDLMPGDWRWINGPRAVSDYPRAEVYKIPRWNSHPLREAIDAAVQRASKKRRLGPITDYS